MVNYIDDYTRECLDLEADTFLPVERARRVPGRLAAA